MRLPAAFVFAALLAPGYAPAQVKGVVTHTGYPATAYPIIDGSNGQGVVTPRTQTMLQIVGAADPAAFGTSEVNVVDAFAYNGFAQYSAERYDRGGPDNGAVRSGEPIGTYSFEPYDGVSDATTAGIVAAATETQVHDTHHGTDLIFSYTPNANGPAKRIQGMAISPGGAGGVVVGSPSGGTKGDLGAGALNVADSIATGSHFRSRGSAPTLSSCGAGPSITGTDAAGAVTTAASTSSCTIAFAKAYTSAPICIVQTYAQPGPVAFLTRHTTSRITVSWPTAFRGTFFYLCQDPS